MPLALKAHAKINLHLDIGPRRKDGYHNLKTLFQEISLHDNLYFQMTDGPIRLTTNNPKLTVGADNIIVKALEMLKRQLKIKKGMSVHLEKQIPMGAGLGGGSSDGAAALKAGWALWKNPSARSVDLKKLPPLLHKCAAKLGADVAFFLQGGTAWAEGIGEKIKKLPEEPQRWMVLVYPRVHVATKEAYQLLDSYRKKHPKQKPTEEIRFNSFEPVILKKYKEIALAKQALIDVGCTETMMSGSGSTVFGFVENSTKGAQVLSRLQQYPWDLFLAHTL